ncbi:Coenzyme F420 hydrogenase/dehydrogenase, beta subunit C-terminal domain [Bradyrhizobium huanghuaihaiense]|uniref:Coenzyme F420 hydrogenase/dehydrogenase, beta subunit C-terminal domain n=1 Tax=Bradyrhizobium huanghuaihaiense TaxID=990078 RepID=UPI0021AA5970|nr:Coenzyme F420 hydrogenase/dehydrogenase, beta subunit C-terminal domain [Bradyrhizobium sp. CB3035]UWU75827.1 Coenzyme F420 hydrogenase/dehydrogenase, beta subunit C-terminal domain [Bradyrhizobium sp. CB3035]
MREIHRSWSTDPGGRHKAAAGGTLSALGRYLLDNGRVEAVLHVRADPRKAWLTMSTISRTPDEVLASAQSRYGPSSPLVNVHQLLDKGARFAVIATPCYISAIRALGRTDPRVERLVPYMLTIFCGGIPSAHLAKAIVRHHGVDEQDVDLFRYRGEGWPGPLRVRTRGGAIYDLSYEDAWRGKKCGMKYGYEVQFRCKICPDAIGDVADISAPDGWVLQDGKPICKEAPGTNLAIVLSVAGEELLHAAISAGYLEVSPVSVDEIGQMHGGQSERKLRASAALFALRLMGQRAIRAPGYRSADAVKRAGIRAVFRQFAGTVRRVKAGENREHLI